MEVTAAANCCHLCVSKSHAKLPILKPPSNFTPHACLSKSKPSFSYYSKSKPSPLLASTTTTTTTLILPFHFPNTLKSAQLRRSNLGNGGPIYASQAETPPPPPPATVVSDKWLLEPVGDGDTRHIGFKVPMPNAFEIASNEVTIGRLPEKADVVIPVATVSAVHARIQKKEGKLLVTDLDSTNGTFIDDKRVSPGVFATVPPGSFLTFGDEHLAVFRVSKLENGEAASSSDPSEDKGETNSPDVEQ